MLRPAFVETLDHKPKIVINTWGRRRGKIIIEKHNFIFLSHDSIEKFAPQNASQVKKKGNMICFIQQVFVSQVEKVCEASFLKCSPQGCRQKIHE